MSPAARITIAVSVAQMLTGAVVGVAVSSDWVASHKVAAIGTALAIGIVGTYFAVKYAL